MSPALAKTHATGAVFWENVADLLAEAVLMALQEKDILVAISMEDMGGHKLPDIELDIYRELRKHLTYSSEYSIRTELRLAMNAFKTAEWHQMPRMRTGRVFSRHQIWRDRVPSAHEQIAFPDKLREVKIDPSLVERIKQHIVRE